MANPLPPLAVAPRLAPLLPYVLNPVYQQHDLAAAYGAEYPGTVLVNWDEDTDISDADTSAPVALVVDCDRLLYGRSYWWDLGRSIVDRHPTIAHLLVSVDDVGRKLTNLGVVLQGIGAPLTSLLIQFHDADTFDGDETTVLDLPVPLEFKPRTAGWACLDDVPTYHDLGALAQVDPR